MEGITEIAAVNNKRYKIYILTAITLLAIVSWFDFFDRMSAEYVDNAIVQGTITFGIARALNAAISVLQSIQVGIFGSSVTIGEMLDPINDLVEQFSTLMKYALGSLIIQKLLLEIVSETFFKILISISGVILFITTFMRTIKYFNIAMKAFIFILFLRYIIVLAITMNAVVDNAFIKEKFEKNVQILESYKIDIESISNMPEVAGEIETALNNDLTELQDKRVQELSKLSNISERISIIEGEIGQIERRLSERKDQIGLVKSINLFNKDEEVKALDSELASKESAHENLLSEKSRVEENLEDMDKDIVSITDRLSGKNKGVLETLRTITSNIPGKIKAFKTKISELVDRMDEAVPTILNLMALFTFRVMILPLIFLYFFLKGFKLIWNIELREFLQRGKSGDVIFDTSEQNA